MRREVGARIAVRVEAEADLVFSVAVAVGANVARESLTASQTGGRVEVEQIMDAHGTRLHRVRAGPGLLELAYSATVAGHAGPAAVTEQDVVRYLRPSRYCESDSLGPTARGEFYGLQGKALLDAVSSWVGTRLEYVPGSSLPTDGAVRTMLARRGVCRDFAHLCVALLRANSVPARLASVYAPGLGPMDFHAVCEALVEGRWIVVDATALAPRSSMVRIATGLDAADTAFLSALSGMVDLVGMEVTAVVDDLPRDDVEELVHLG